jgi:glycosyltransferase involved in cell wall biosynthesis
MLQGLALAGSGEARARALEQAARFNWEASARRLLEIYRALLSSL